MGWVDTHCHLQLDGRDPGELLDRADAVDWLIVPGIDLASSEAARDLTALDPARVGWTAGLHPHDADRLAEERDGIARLVEDGPVALGETGLDYYRNLSDPSRQREAFAFHLDLAGATGLPVVVHCRDAFADVYRMVETAGLGERAILHCWTGGPRWTKRFLELGATFSFAGPVAFETGDTVRLGAAVVPPGRAMVETDTPYLAPPPHRTEPNEPAWVALVGEALASVWAMSASETAEVTSATARRIFGWGS
jgi:TatD DNase family protein